MISVSFLKSIYDREETIKKIEESKADLIHVDLMDGKYVPSKNFQIDEIIALLKNCHKPLDIHLMVKNPLKYIKKLVKLKPFIITIHLDATKNVLKTINYLKKHNIKVGVALNPTENIDVILKYIDKIDYCLVMSVAPGLGGQEFIPSVLDKIKYLKEYHLLVGIDGGINDNVIKTLKDYQLDIIVSGSYICMALDFDEKIDILKKALE